MLGIDNGVLGEVQVYPAFLEEWCVGPYGDSISCDAENIGDNKKFGQVFIVLSSLVLPVGAAVSSLLFAPSVADMFGRRPCMALGGLFTMFASYLAAYQNHGSEVAFYMLRVLIGFGVGTCCYALPLYVSEIAPPSMRGSMGSLFQFFTVLGPFVAMKFLKKMTNWQLAMLAPGYPGAFLCVAIWFLPESPRWIMMKHDKDAATVALRKFRSGDVTAEINSIAVTMEEEARMPKVTFSDMKTNTNLRNRCLVGVGMQIAQQMTGVNCFLGFSGSIFAAVGIEHPAKFGDTFTNIFFVGVVLGIALMDSRFSGRRTQLLLASVLMPLSLLGAAVTYSLDAGQMWQKICLGGYAFAFQFGWGLVPWVYPAEIFSMNERSKFVAVTMFSQYIINGLIYVVSAFLIYWSPTGMYLTFFGFCILNLLFVAFYVKETKGVPLEQVKQLFGGDISKTMPA